MSGESAAVAPRAAGRGKLTPERQRELYEAVLELLRERGYDALTMDAVAARSRASKATLYRQWGTKAQFVVAALRHTKRTTLADIDTGTLLGDIREMARRVAADSEESTGLLHALLHAGQRDAELLRAVREVLVEPETDVLTIALHRAVGRGEIAPRVPATDYLVHAFMGAIMTRPLFEGTHADAEYLDRFIDAVVIPALGLDDLDDTERNEPGGPDPGRSRAEGAAPIPREEQPTDR
ncbi:TetR family transcriptional regulator [Streptomyces alkaliphilus]|uniref:TetR family transcriptional regulator n=1 Tax=Streptomyces alkaliphilus TaxID=1472722 RepID=A0A7W3THT0_9ACTN|nr:TetR/AcrR family transcriptional regulator [Streptomyces alkaliphilus]MBB0247118.1 TetR family transcriptional regulator [Streptomyces alkaliphilus]